jgi:hypothetical protein
LRTTGTGYWKASSHVLKVRGSGASAAITTGAIVTRSNWGVVLTCGGPPWPNVLPRLSQSTAS